MPAPSALTFALILMIFGFGQGLLMAPLSGTVLSSVKPASRRFRLGHARYRGPDRQCGGYCRNRCGVFAIETVHSAHQARFVSIALLILSIVTSAALLSWKRRAAASSLSAWRKR